MNSQVNFETGTSFILVAYNFSLEFREFFCAVTIKTVNKKNKI